MITVQEDQAWFRHIKQGNEEAVGQLWQYLYRLSLTLAYDWQKDDGFAYEIAAAAYDRIMKKGIHQYKGQARFSSYCKTILVNMLNSTLRKESRFEEIEGKEIQIEDGESQAEVTVVRNRLQVCIDALPEKEKQVIERLYFEDKKPEIVAEEIGHITRNYLQVLAWRARNALRQCLEKNGFKTTDDVLSL